MHLRVEKQLLEAWERKDEQEKEERELEEAKKIEEEKIGTPEEQQEEEEEMPQDEKAQQELPKLRSIPTFALDPKTGKYSIHTVRTVESRENFRKLAKSVSGQLESLQHQQSGGQS